MAGMYYNILLWKCTLKRNWIEIELFCLTPYYMYIRCVYMYYIHAYGFHDFTFYLNDACNISPVCIKRSNKTHCIIY